mmetsp:Transcript_8576/g.20066  ORF Transcript_8576/g.20066 Transcript_8576/m.20066 type:complete len:309 (-) Transcript_8576:142-1068(-)
MASCPGSAYEKPTAALWMVEITFGLMAFASNFSLLLVNIPKEQRRMIFPLRFYVLVNLFTLWCAFILSLVQYPDGQWLVIAFDIAHNMIYVGLFLFLKEKRNIAEASLRNVRQMLEVLEPPDYSGPNSTSSGELITANEDVTDVAPPQVALSCPWAVLESVKSFRHLELFMMVAGNVAILAATVNSILAGFVNTHRLDPSGQWYQEVGPSCYDCLPAAIINCIGFICFCTLAWITLARSIAGGASGKQKQLAVGYAASNLAACSASFLTGTLVMITFWEPIAPKDVLTGLMAIYIGEPTHPCPCQPSE